MDRRNILLEMKKEMEREWKKAEIKRRSLEKMKRNPVRMATASEAVIRKVSKHINEDSYKGFQELLERSGLTPYAVSKLSGIPTATLSNWKNGKISISTETACRLAILFDVSMDYFYPVREWRKTIDREQEEAEEDTAEAEEDVEEGAEATDKARTAAAEEEERGKIA